MTLLFTCRKCGVQAPSLEGHRCISSVPAPDRLERARAVLNEVEGRLVEALPRLAAPVAPPKAGFDRNAYHKAYMKTYMRARRARRGTIPG